MPNTRKLPLGEQNMVGARVSKRRKELGLTQTQHLAKLQIEAISISHPALSLLEGQKRPVVDFELAALSKVLDVSVSELMGLRDK